MCVVQEKGLLRKQGVDAEIIGINASTISMQALLAGYHDVIGPSVSNVGGTRLAGADTMMVQTLVPTCVDHIVSVSSFFFSSRRRHTRSLRDWSSDVCSSD